MTFREFFINRNNGVKKGWIPLAMAETGWTYDLVRRAARREIADMRRDVQLVIAALEENLKAYGEK